MFPEIPYQSMNRLSGAAELFEADQFSGFLIPEPEPVGPEAGPEGNRLNLVHQFIFAVTLLQLVIGYFGAEVVDVVEPDIP